FKHLENGVIHRSFCCVQLLLKSWIAFRERLAPAHHRPPSDGHTVSLGISVRNGRIVASHFSTPPKPMVPSQTKNSWAKRWLHFVTRWWSPPSSVASLIPMVDRP